MLTENTWFSIAFILFYAFYYERIMYAEESFLRSKFGDIYLNFSKNVPAFIPSFKHYIKPLESFSVKKILKKEKNGFNAIFILFYIFSFAENIIEKGKFEIAINLWFYAALTSTIIYFILKYLKWRTSVLDESGR